MRVGWLNRLNELNQLPADATINMPRTRSAVFVHRDILSVYSRRRRTVFTHLRCALVVVRIDSRRRAVFMN